MTEPKMDRCGKCGDEASYDCRTTVRGAEFSGKLCPTCFEEFKKHMAEIGAQPKWRHGGQS
jgi:hypothetical protein